MLVAASNKNTVCFSTPPHPIIPWKSLVAFSSSFFSCLLLEGSQNVEALLEFFLSIARLVLLNVPVVTGQMRRQLQAPGGLGCPFLPGAGWQQWQDLMGAEDHSLYSERDGCHWATLSRDVT